jgi:peptidase M28-like protein
MTRASAFFARGVIAGILFVPALGIAQSRLPVKHAPKPTTQAITADDAMTRLYIFADDSMQGRRAGEEGSLKGTAYIEREVRRLGLVPAGDSGTFFQAVPLITRTVDMSSSLKADDQPIVLGADILPVGISGIPASLDGARIIFAGDATDSLKSVSPAQAVGKVVLVTSSGAAAGQRYPGAVGVITVIQPEQFTRLRGFASGRSTRMRSDADTVHTRLALAIPPSTVQKLLGVPLENARPGTLGRTFHGTVQLSTGPAPARNVVAILRGSDPKLRSEYVALGAHNDHLGVRRAGPLDHDSLKAYNEAAERIYVARTHEGTEFPGSGLTAEERASIHVNVDSLRRIRPARLDSIYNGADDDGSGSMGLLEVAEKFALAKEKPKRSLIFVWHTGEELGLYGSQWFTDHPSIPRDSIVAQLNMDMIGRGEAADIPGGGPHYVELIGSRRLSTELGDLVEAVNKSGGHNFTFDYTFDASGHPEQIYCRSDHYEYARYGIPITFITTGGHSDYHQLTDEPEYINYPHLASVANLVADVATHLANLDHRVVVDKAKPDPHGRCVQ